MVGSLTSVAVSFPCGFWFCCLRASRRGYLHPRWWRVISKNFLIGEWHQWFHWLLVFLYTYCQLVGLAGPGWLGFFSPLLQGLGLSWGLLLLPHSIVLASKVPITKGKEGIPLNRVGCGWWGIVIFFFPSETLCFRQLKGSPYFFGKVNEVSWSRELLKFWPPGWSLYPMGAPSNPFLGVIKGWLGHQRLIWFVPTTARQPYPRKEFPYMWVQYWQIS